MTREEAIKAAPKAYPDGDLIPVDMENMGPQELLEAARKREFGDTLLSFIVIELFAGLDASDDGQVDMDRGVELIDRAIRDLQACFHRPLQQPEGPVQASNTSSPHNQGRMVGN